MTEMSPHDRPVQLPDVPEGEEISPADARERTDQDPEDQQNRVDPVWSESSDHEAGGRTDRADPDDL
jgi:hypothetical protein